MDPFLYDAMLRGEPHRTLAAYDVALSTGADDWDTWFGIDNSFFVIEMELRIVDPALKARFRAARADAAKRLNALEASIDENNKK